MSPRPEGGRPARGAKWDYWQENGRRGDDDVQVNVGRGAPVELAAGPKVSVSTGVPSEVANV